MSVNNKKCGRRVRPTRYAPPAFNDKGTTFLFPELRRGKDETCRRCELMSLTFDLGGHSACGWCGSSSSIRIPSLKFVGLAIRNLWRSMCVSINGPGDPDLWPFDLETGVRVASKVGNLPSKFEHARPLGSRLFAMYATDRQTDWRTDKSNAYCPLPYGEGHNYAAKCRYVTIKTEKVSNRGLMTLQFVDCSSDKSISNSLRPVHCHLSSFDQSITGISSALDESVLADGRLSRASCGTALTAVGCGRLL